MASAQSRAKSVFGHALAIEAAGARTAYLEQQQARMPIPDRRRFTEAAERLVRFYEATGQPQKAQEWREKAKPRRPKAASSSVRENKTQDPAAAKNRGP